MMSSFFEKVVKEGPENVHEDQLPNLNNIFIIVTVKIVKIKPPPRIVEKGGKKKNWNIPEQTFL